ncbi:hypothetical protein PS15m_005634 [Mucor circinelloides]
MVNENAYINIQNLNLVSIATADQCYSLNVPAMIWTCRSLIVPLTVLVENAVFTLLGIDKNFSRKYPLDTDSTGSSSRDANGLSNGDARAEGEREGSSSEATVGIAVGCSILVIIDIKTFMMVIEQQIKRK